MAAVSDDARDIILVLSMSAILAGKAVGATKRHPQYGHQDTADGRSTGMHDSAQTVPIYNPALLIMASCVARLLRRGLQLLPETLYAHHGAEFSKRVLRCAA